MEDKAIATRTRFAPTPSGYLHIGNLTHLLVVQQVARKHNLSILLRIDDLDRQRYKTAYVQYLFDVLQIYDISMEGPRDISDFEQRYSQLHRLPIYKQWLDELVSEGMAFPCTCSRTDVFNRTGSARYDGYCLQHTAAPNKPVAYRFNTANLGKVAPRWTEVKNVVDREMPFFKVWTIDDRPSYQLASVADDVYYQVSHIVRGTDLWPSTCAQLLLAKAVPSLHPFLHSTFYHHPVLVDQYGDKLSKSVQKQKEYPPSLPTYQSLVQQRDTLLTEAEVMNLNLV